MKGLRLPRKRYLYAGLVVLVVFVVVLVRAGLGAALFWSALAGVVLFYLSFDPRLRRHWW